MEVGVVPRLVMDIQTFSVAVKPQPLTAGEVTATIPMSFAGDSKMETSSKAKPSSTPEPSVPKAMRSLTEDSPPNPVTLCLAVPQPPEPLEDEALPLQPTLMPPPT